MRNRAPASAGGLLLAALAAFGCSAAISPVEIEAARTAARVKTALVNDAVLGTRIIDVRVEDGVVQLSGRVSDEAEAARAVELARAVPGVSAVDSRLRTGDAPAEPPAGLDSDGPQRGPALEFAELEREPDLLALGASVGLANPRGRASGTRATLSPLIRVGRGRGLGPTVAFDWFSATPIAPPDTAGDVGRLRVRPIMAGLRYTFLVGRLSIAPSLVAGYAFNSLSVPQSGAAEQLSVGVGNSFAWRPGVGFWIESGRRTGIHLSVGRVFTRPGLTVVSDGRFVRRHMDADATVVLIGLAYKVF